MYVLFILMLCWCDPGVTFEMDFGNISLLTPMPDYFDWRNRNMVSPVKDQETCAACWAFSAVANIESTLRIYLKQDVTLSEQFLIDCNPDRAGCGPTSLLKTFSNIVAVLGGVLQESDYYPYESRAEACRWNRVTPPVPVVGFRRVNKDEIVMKWYLYNNAPLAAGINSASMKVYTGGIDEPTEEACEPTKRDHSVLIVGYSTYLDEKSGKATDYWIIKNSWSTKWGDQGYYYLVRGRNACGIAEDVALSYVQ